MQFRGRIEHARELLTDVAQTAFFFVTLPEALPIAVIAGSSAGSPTSASRSSAGSVVNQVIQEEPGTEMPEFVRNRMTMQRTYLEQIGWTSPGWSAPSCQLYHDEIQGRAALDRASPDLFA